MKTDERILAIIQEYLNDVAARLEGMPEPERQDLLIQLEAHIHEALEARTGGGVAQASDVEAVLSEMDPPASYESVGTGSRLAGMRRGQWALAISLGSLVLVGLLSYLSPPEMAFVSLFFVGQISAFVLGVLSWRDPFGKAAVFTSALMVVALLLCAA